MAETSNYQLNQWAKTDRIQMEDFNADNLKTDQALAKQRDEITALTAAVALCGNCQIVYGSYKGTGTNGSTAPNELIFPHKPIFVLVQSDATESLSDIKLRMMRNVRWAVGNHGNSNWKIRVTWTENSVQWYNSLPASGSPSTQFNTGGQTYHYMALLDTNA